MKIFSLFNLHHTWILRVGHFFLNSYAPVSGDSAILLQSSNMALKYVVSWKTFAEIPGLSLLSECKTLFVILSHKFGSEVRAGLFVSGFSDSVVRMDEPDFYSWWQVEKGWAPASAYKVGWDSNKAREVGKFLCFADPLSSIIPGLWCPPHCLAHGQC